MQDTSMLFVDHSRILFEPETHSGRAERLRPNNLHKEVRAFTSKASALAEQIINKDIIPEKQNGNTESRVVIRHYYTPWHSSFWWTYPQTVYVIPSNSERRQDSENNWRFFVGLAAAIIGGVALFAIGSAIPRLQDSDRELDEARDFGYKLDAYQAHDLNEAELVSEARHLVDLKARICKRIKESAAADLALRIGLAVGCGTALFAALAVGSGALMTTGAIVALIASGGMLFKYGYENNDKSNLLDAIVLRKISQELNTKL